MHTDILRNIIAKKLEFPSTYPIPTKRECPITPFLQYPGIICEIKRKSPSKGVISSDLDPVSQAQTYVSSGIRSISVLTEEHYFHGSIADLLAVKRAHPDCAVLQKDFILSQRDVETAYLIGADAILLIASILDPESMEQLIKKAREYGMQTLVEVHTKEEIEAIAPLSPPLIGINARNLNNFTVDPLLPLSLRSLISWNARCVFESGIHSQQGLLLALYGGFDAVLVGESVVKNPELTEVLVKTYRRHREESNETNTAPSVQNEKKLEDFTLKRTPSADEDSLYGKNSCVFNSSFWQTIAKRIANNKEEGLPLVKICGICSREDALRALELGADMLGFILAESKRRVDPAFIASLADLNIIKIGVIELKNPARGTPPRIPQEIRSLLSSNMLDALQLHGDESQETVTSVFPCYKALRIGNKNDILHVDQQATPRVLLDAYSPKARGGTGLRISDELLSSLPSEFPLWLAGGLSPNNVEEIVRKYRPECIDISSGLEISPREKSHEKMKLFFSSLRRC